MNNSEIFNAAAALPRHQREAYLDEVCGSDKNRRAEIESLLRSDDVQDSFLEHPAVDDLDRTGKYQPISESSGSRVGPYRLMEQIGEGGFGLVFVAEQQKPVRRKVALKIIKPGMDTREVVARFEAERQALALMDHPNIAKVLDAGTTDSGRPFFVMELIRGVPIVDYCDNHQLTTEQRLQLFVDVCRAVQHAHSKGVIHRDLKPSNVLVSPHDGVPVVKVIDFGIAKAIGQQLTDKTIYTRLTQMIGTPLYMSPEQAEINALDVDTRSDVYSLGVLLYEMLTGATPFDRERFFQAAHEEIKRIIREEDPPSPSKRISTLGETIATVSKQRKTNASHLTATLRGELDWIVMCCLEKERSRRYQTVAELAADINRYLNTEPVQVVPPNQVYRLRKTVRRHRVAIAIAVGYVMLSLIGTGTSLWQYGNAKQQATLAESRAAQLTKSNNTLKETLKNLNDALLEQALAAALSGDNDTFQAAMNELPQVPENEATARHLRALFGITSGVHVNESVLDMQQLVAEHPKDVSAWSILNISSKYITLDLDANSEAEGILSELKPDTELQGILKAIAMPQEGVHDLREFAHRKPGWAVARAAHATAQCDLWHIKREPSALKLARQEIDAASLLLPDHPFVKSVNLQVATAAYIDRGEHEQSTAESLERGEIQAQNLRRDFRDYAFAQRIVGEFYTVIEDYEQAIIIWERLIKDRQSSKAMGFAVPLWILSHRDPGVPVSALPYSYYQLKGDAEGFHRTFQEASSKNSNLSRAWRPFTLKWLGQPEEAARAAEQIESLTTNQAWWIADIAKLARGDVNADQLMEMAKNNRQQQNVHLMALAWNRLADRDGKNDAIEYLDRAISLNNRIGHSYYWCLAMRQKLEEDPDWLANFKQELDDFSKQR